MTIARQLKENGLLEGLMKGREEGFQEGTQKGRQEGLQPGEEHATHKIARTMLTEGFDLKAIIKVTGLSEDAVMWLSR